MNSELTADSKAATSLAKLTDDQVITIGDLSASSAAKKIERLLPLADYLAANLAEFGIVEGEVIIAADTDHMVELVSQGKIDIFMDSPFPTLQIQEATGSRIVARRWKDNSAEYWSTFVALDDSGIESIEDLKGKVIAFEEPYSTSGFLLPAGTLAQQGFDLVELASPDQAFASNQVGYVFTGDEENTFLALTRGQVDAAGVSNQDYEELPAEYREEITAFYRTITVPRQLVSVSPTVSPEMADQIGNLLFALERTEAGRELLAGLKKTTKFDEPPVQLAATMKQIQELDRFLAD